MHQESLQEVRDYVRIIYLEQVYSLSFLGNLTKIGGKRKYKNLQATEETDYALYIAGNENLRELQLNENLRIEEGRVR